MFCFGTISPLHQHVGFRPVSPAAGDLHLSDRHGRKTIPVWFPYRLANHWVRFFLVCGFSPKFTLITFCINENTPKWQLVNFQKK